MINRLGVTRLLFTLSITGALFFGAALAALAQKPDVSTPEPAPTKRRALPTDTKEWKGDFDGMVKRRHIRMVVPYSRTLYFNDHGRERGLTADNARDFEGYINKKYKKQLGNRPITVYLIPTTRDLLLQKVADGLETLLQETLRLPRIERQWLILSHPPTRSRFRS
jgi:hypothetical protein